MPKYELSDAVGLFSQHTSIINSLWTVYVAATFTAAGFGISSGNIGITVAMAITVGFWAFTLGHLHLLRQALSVHKSLMLEINTALEANADESISPFRSPLQILANTATLSRAPTRR